jgi:hypothetical protein
MFSVNRREPTFSMNPHEPEYFVNHRGRNHPVSSCDLNVPLNSFGLKKFSSRTSHLPPIAQPMILYHTLFQPREVARQARSQGILKKMSLTT